MSKPITSTNTRSAGFTLLELIVGIALLGLITVMLSDGVRFAGAVWKRESHAQMVLEDKVVGRDVFRRLMAQALPMRVDRQRLIRGAVAFNGDKRQIRFVSPPPDHVDDGAPYLIDFVIESSKGQSELVMRSRPLESDLSDFDQEKIVHESLLIRGFATASFAYFKKPLQGDGGEWTTEWKNKEDLPNLVRLTIEESDRSSHFPSEVIARLRSSSVQ